MHMYYINIFKMLSAYMDTGYFYFLPIINTNIVNMEFIMLLDIVIFISFHICLVRRLNNRTNTISLAIFSYILWIHTRI